jgi:hypothetical protein
MYWEENISDCNAKLKRNDRLNHTISILLPHHLRPVNTSKTAPLHPSVATLRQSTVQFCQYTLLRPSMDPHLSVPAPATGHHAVLILPRLQLQW